MVIKINNFSSDRLLFKGLSYLSSEIAAKLYAEAHTATPCTYATALHKKVPSIQAKKNNQKHNHILIRLLGILPFSLNLLLIF